MGDSALSAKRLAELRAALEASRGDLQARLAEAENAARPVELDQQSFGRVSRIDAIQQQQMAIAGQQQSARLLQRIDLALQRLERGDYGYCNRCGEAIAYARLRVQPFASLCMDCQSASERG